jgi:hypothetical protein
MNAGLNTRELDRMRGAIASELRTENEVAEPPPRLIALLKELEIRFGTPSARRCLRRWRHGWPSCYVLPAGSLRMHTAQKEKMPIGRFSPSDRQKAALAKSAECGAQEGCRT